MADTLEDLFDRIREALSDGNHKKATKLADSGTPQCRVFVRYRCLNIL
jgi:hypothetical protein